MLTQEQIIEQYFTRHTGTMLECSKMTGIERANICRWIPKAEDRGFLKRVRMGYCRISGRRATFFHVID